MLDRLCATAKSRRPAPSKSLVTTERGFDPRDHVLVPFGGAGPLHAASVASDLGIAQVVVPPSAGVISAYGLIASDFTQFTSLPVE